MTQLAINRAESEDLRKFLVNIERSAEMLMRLINDVLDFSRIDSGQMVAESAPFNLRELVDQLKQFAEKRCSEKELMFVCLVEPNIPELMVGDALRIKQILVNLIDNAVKFTEQGKVVLDVSYSVNTSSDYGVLKFQVIDTGIGIDESDVPLLFDSFAQLDSSITRQYGGTGLGLALCQKLASLMNGVIEVDSVRGEGSTFRLVMACPGPEMSVTQTNTPEKGDALVVSETISPAMADSAIEIATTSQHQQAEHEVPIVARKKIASFDLIQLFEKVNHSEATLKRLLTMFSKDYSAALDDNLSLIETLPLSVEEAQQQTSTLIDRVHALKGVAGNLCNPYIHTLAKDIEKALREEGGTDLNLEHVRSLFSLAQKEALELKEVLQSYDPSDQNEVDDIEINEETKQSFLQLLSEIAEKMANSFMVESDELEQLKALGSQLGLKPSVEELEQSLSSFDYPKAEKLMMGISDQLTVQ
jgi:HPt (histidine-containing phosphotransfer) domain-containing protein